METPLSPPVRVALTLRGKVMANLGAQKKRSLQKQPASNLHISKRKKGRIVTEKSPEKTEKDLPLPTGKTSPRKRRTADQIEQDLICKPVNACNHSDEDNPLLAEWASWNAGYYTDAHQKKMNGKDTKFPTSCAGKCNRKFVGGTVKIFDKEEYKVTSTKPVRLCPNAANPNHKCTFGLCVGCYSWKVLAVDVNTQLQAKKDGKGNKRTRRGGSDSTKNKDNQRKQGMKRTKKTSAAKQ
jgi:hypothetical protein